jgi:hypothetical protein
MGISLSDVTYSLQGSFIQGFDARPDIVRTIGYPPCNYITLPRLRQLLSLLEQLSVEPTGAVELISPVNRSASYCQIAPLAGLLG